MRNVATGIFLLLILLIGCGGGDGGGGSTGGTGGGGPTKVSGQILVDSDTTPVSGVVVRFFDNKNALVGQATSGADGRFTASVSLTAVTFDVLGSSIPAGFYKSYRYNANYYIPGQSCRPSLPTLQANATVPLQSAIELPSTSGPPPPPPPFPCR